VADANKVLQQFLEKTVDKMENVAVELGYDIADRAMRQSPVYTGQYKASMRASVNSEDTSREPIRPRVAVQGPSRGATSVGTVGDVGEVQGEGGPETDAMYNQVYLDFDANDDAIYISNSTSYEEIPAGAAAIEFQGLAATTPEGVLLVAYEAFKGSMNQVIARAIQEN
jgi:hypothetical protein